MDAVEIWVTVLGTALIAGVLWFFFGPRRVAAAAATAAGVQEARILVKGGYSPDVIAVRRGSPVRLSFYRDEDAACSDTVVLGDFGISRPLPAFETTHVEFTPTKAGRFPFTCGMGMLRGTLVVQPDERVEVGS
jgi:plastocyanin domain-containing protein